MSSATLKGPSSPTTQQDASSIAQTETPAQPAAPQVAVSRIRQVTGRVLSGLASLFLLFDAAGKFAIPPQVAQAFNRLGLSLELSAGIGVLLLTCTLVYMVPRTAILGAVLLTGYLGGAVAIQLRAGSSLFETIFPVLIALLVWGGIYLREFRVRALLPIRR